MLEFTIVGEMQIKIITRHPYQQASHNEKQLHILLVEM